MIYLLKQGAPAAFNPLLNVFKQVMYFLVFVLFNKTALGKRNFFVTGTDHLLLQKFAAQGFIKIKNV